MDRSPLLGRGCPLAAVWDPQPGAVRPGYQEIRAKYYVKSKASRSQLEQVKKMAEDLSPTRDSLRAVRFSSELIIEN